MRSRCAWFTWVIAVRTRIIGNARLPLASATARIPSQSRSNDPFTALSENLTKRPLLRNFLHPLNCEEPTLVTAIRLAMDERHRSGWFERDAEGAGLRLNWAGHGE